MTENLTPALMLVAGLGAGTLVTLVARALPERGRLVSRPICAAQGCSLGWSAASQALRSLGTTLAVHAAFATLLMVILAIDLRHREVYLVLGYGGIALALLAAPMSMSGGLFSAAVGSMIGGLGAVAILATGGSRKVIMPYGPALCLGGLWAMLIR